VLVRVRGQRGGGQVTGSGPQVTGVGGLCCLSSRRIRSREVVLPEFTEDQGRGGVLIVQVKATEEEQGQGSV